MNEPTKELTENNIWKYRGLRFTEHAQELVQNYDFSAFPLLLEKTYLQMQIINENLCDLMPFCLYQHAMFEILNQYIMALGTELFSYYPNLFLEQYLAINIPKPIKLYIECIQEGFLSGNKTIYTNIPDAAIPKQSIEIKNDNGEIIRIPAGSFGPITAETHNLYECYASPLISKKLIERTIYANDKNDFEPWNPLPSGAYPPDSVCTQNLIGYRLPEKLSNKALNILRNIEFCNGNKDYRAILCHSSKVISIVHNVLEQFNNKYEIEKGIQRREIRYNKRKIFGFIETIEEDSDIDIKNNLFNSEICVCSPQKLNKITFLTLLITGLRRRRNYKRPGYCMIKSDGNAIEGWEETMNDNFEMNGIFCLSKIENDHSNHIYNSEFLKKKFFEDYECLLIDTVMDYWLKKFEKKNHN